MKNKTKENYPELLDRIQEIASDFRFTCGEEHGSCFPMVLGDAKQTDKKLDSVWNKLFNGKIKEYDALKQIKDILMKYYRVEKFFK